MEWLEGLKPITWINDLGSCREGPTFAEDSRNLLKTSVVSGLNPSRSHDSRHKGMYRTRTSYLYQQWLMKHMNVCLIFSLLAVLSDVGVDCPIT